MTSVQHPNRNNNIATPIKTGQLDHWLDGYDLPKKQFLLQGFTTGFRIPYTKTRTFLKSKNLKSALDNLPILKEKINREIVAGRVAGPFIAPPFKNLHISPLGLVPKKAPGDFRIIQHLSYPEGSSINDGIPDDLCSVHYQNIDNAVELVKKFGRGCLLSKIDIQEFFRIIPISERDWELLGFCIGNEYYHDKVLPQGLSCSCALAEQFSCALQWIVENKLRLPGCAHILDDFLFVGPPDYGRCLSNLHQFLDLAKALGIPIKQEKTVLPTTTLTFVGIEIDSQLFEKRLPAEKLEKIGNLLSEFQNRKKVTLKELQSIIGLLNFACSVVSPGRTFLRRLIDLTVGLKRPDHKKRLNREAKRDLQAWSLFIKHFNGKSVFLPDVWIDSVALDLFTDSSNTGFGGYLGNRWFGDVWPDEWKPFHITVKEIFPIVLALELWADQLKNKCIIFHCDNNAVVHIINRQSSKEKALMTLVRRLVLQTMKFNIMFKAEHLSSAENYLADKISRQQVTEFLQHFHHKNPVREDIPMTSFVL